MVVKGKIGKLLNIRACLFCHTSAAVSWPACYIKSRGLLSSNLKRGPAKDNFELHRLESGLEFHSILKWAAQSVYKFTSPLILQKSTHWLRPPWLFVVSKSWKRDYKRETIRRWSCKRLSKSLCNGVLLLLFSFLSSRTNERNLRIEVSVTIFFREIYKTLRVIIDTSFR